MLAARAPRSRRRDDARENCRIPQFPFVVKVSRPQTKEVSMKYMMFVATDANPDQGTESADDVVTWLADVNGRGKRLAGDRLRPVEDATTVRVRASELLVTDGPFTESKEWIAGFDILECDDLDEAIEIASRHPMARFGKIELRPFWPMEG
jgi:hypothetical protein